MAPSLTVEQRLDLITRNLPAEDITNVHAIRTALETPGKKPKCLWVTSPTGKPHVGYYIPLLKFADFLKADCEIIVVLLDVYSFLDNVKYPWEQVRQRMYYYKYVVVAALASIGISEDQVTYVEESSYQFSERWIRDQWRLNTIVPQQAVRDAWDRSYNPDMLSPLACPPIQTLAEEHLDVDFQFGGADQRGIFGFAERFLPQLGYRERGHMMNAMVPNLYGTKMSSSHPPKTKIMYLDDSQAVVDKITEAPWNGLDLATNGTLSLLKNILIPAARLRSEKQQKQQKDATGTNGVNGHAETNGVNGHGSTNGVNGHGSTNGVNGHAETNGANGHLSADGANGINAAANLGGAADVFAIEVDGKPRTFTSYEEIESALADGSLHVDAVKLAVAQGLNDLLDHVRKAYKVHPDWKTVEQAAYPDVEQQ